MTTTRTNNNTNAGASVAATHTPGPWVYVAGPKNYIGAKLTKTGFTPIAQGLGRSDEDRANGMLMAAAPELLEALKIAALALDPQNRFEPDHADARQLALHMIAKAEGRASA